MAREERKREPRAGGVRRPLPPRSVELLRCPRCGGKLALAPSEVRCEGDCRGRFPVVAGVPVLVDESESVFDQDQFEPSGEPSHFWVSVRELAKRALPDTSWNLAAGAVLGRLAGDAKARSERPLVLILGAKHAKKTTGSLLEDPDLECVEADLDLGSRANLIFDPHRIPFVAESLDLVVVDAILEHVVDPARVAAEVHRVLRPEGLVFSDTPFMLQVHGGAYDFARFSANGQRWLFRGFEEVESGVTSGPGAALASSIQYFLLSFVRRNWARFGIKTLCRATLFWLKYFDLHLARRPGALDAALGLYFVGRKAGREIPADELLASYRGITPDLYRGRNAPRARR